MNNLLDQLHAALLTRNGAEIISIAEQIDRAYQDGKIVEPPCMVGDKVYAIKDEQIYECEVFELKYLSELEHGGTTFTREKVFAWHGGIPFLLDFWDFGKTVFLTREEAEQALKECEKNG